MKYTDDEVNLIVADGFRELTYKHKKLFLAAQTGGGQSAEYADELIKTYGVGVYNKLKEKFYDGNYRAETLALLEKKRVECVTYKSADYPENLKHIGAPPIVLYLRGNAGLLGEKIFAVVGSRKTSAQTLQECRNICGELAKHFVIATGIADGADNAAALGALPSGKIICVLPCGHGYVTDTLRKVEESGLSVSEFPPGTRAQRHTFTLRNRILAGLCSGVLVVSAGKKSGAISTANYAVEYGKDVFAFPYGIGAASGAGCNRLIKSGAFLCDCVEDIYFAMRIDYETEQDEPELEDDEKAVLAVLKEQGETHAEKLAAAVNKKPYELSAICSSLEIKGLLVRTGGNKFAAL